MVSKKLVWLSLVCLVVSLFLLVPFAVCDVMVDGNVHFGYWNGTFITNAGTYGSVVRDNVTDEWLFDGVAFPLVATSVFDWSVLIFAFIVLSIVVVALPYRLWLLRFGFGLFEVVLAVSQLQNSTLLFYPWILVLWIFMAVLVIYSSFARND